MSCDEYNEVWCHLACGHVWNCKTLAETREKDGEREKDKEGENIENNWRPFFQKKF